jgi:uncharacterized SAM-binding protein YcdF (DUF218 family)
MLYNLFVVTRITHNVCPDAIIPLAAGLGRDKKGQPIRADQIAHTTYRLWCELPEVIIVTNGGKIAVDGRSESQIMRDALIKLGIPESAIHSEYSSMDTFENARDMGPYLADKKSLLIVATAPQTRRALLVFAKVYPNKDLDIIPIHPEHWDDTDQAGLRSPTKFVMREIAAFILFKLQGKI